MSKKIVNTNRLAVLIAAVLAGSPAFPMSAQTVGHGVSAGLINVVQNDGSNTSNSVTVTLATSVNQFSLRDGSNRGDYLLQIGTGFSDDADSGVMISCVAENGRDNQDTNSPGVNFCTSTVDFARTGGTAGAYFVSSFSAPSGAEYNINVAAAFFSYSNWIGGIAVNSGATNGGANDTFTGSSGLVLGTHFIDNGGGVSTVNLKSLGINSQTDGVLLVSPGKNEDNYALSTANADGTWTLFSKDNGTDADAHEQDPMAFVFIPKTNTSVISGRFQGDGSATMFSGAVPAFNVTNTTAGTWRLTIPGQSPASGVLIISAEGGTAVSQDNIVSYAPDGDGWIIQSRDLPGNPPGLQTPAGDVASFVFIPAAATATPITPPQNAENRSTSPKLQVSISNNVPSDFTVKFYGRKATVGSGEDFTIVALPDTQYYTAERFGGKKEMFIAQTEWIITNRVSRNIAYVTQLGDISDQGDVKSGVANTIEWKNATNAMYRLEDSARTMLTDGIPYGVAVGNHDSEPNGDANGTTKFYNQYFGVPHFAGNSYYAGHFGTNNDNHFDFFSAGGMDFIVLYFEYDTNTTAAALTWGDQVLQTNQNRRAIIVTHNFGNTSTPVNFSAQGAAIYNKLKHHTNVFMMLAGHVTGAGSRADTYNGNTIRTFVSDYQGWTNGGNGFLRIMTFSPSNNQVVVQTYSPWTDEYRTESNHEFFFNYNMQQVSSAPFTLLGTSSNVPSGGVASLTWPGLEVGSTYEWRVVLTDNLNNNTTSQAWRFTTGPNMAPVVSNRLVTVTGDAPTNFVLAAVDGNGDAVTFVTNSTPSFGLNVNFDPATGFFTYVPAHGFRGFNHFVYSAKDAFSTSSLATFNINVVAPPDANGNGIPDQWETNYGITNADADDDRDGETNLEEYYANTNPTNAASVLHISSAAKDGVGHVTLVWPSVGGSRYRVQFSTGDANGSFNGIFTDIVRSVDREMDPAPVGTPSTQIFVDDFTQTGNAPTNVPRFYRIKVVQ